MDLPLNIDFSGKVVVVTGAGGVLCGDMAKAFAQAGAKVAALDLNEEAVKKLAEDCKAQGWTCEGYKANVLEPEALEAVHQQVLKDLGPCDILVNGAGGNNPRATTDNEYQHEWSEGQKGFFDLDAGGRGLCVQAELPGHPAAHPGVRQGHGDQEVRLHPEHFFHERLYPAD